MIIMNAYIHTILYYIISIYPACSLSHNDHKLFCLLSDSNWVPKSELLWIVVKFPFYTRVPVPFSLFLARSAHFHSVSCLHFWLIALYIAQRMRVQQNVNAAKPQKKSKSKSKKYISKIRRNDFGIDHHLAVCHQHLFLYLSLSLWMLIIKSKVSRIVMRTGPDREIVIGLWNTHTHRFMESS